MRLSGLIAGWRRNTIRIRAGTRPSSKRSTRLIRCFLTRKKRRSMISLARPLSRLRRGAACMALRASAIFPLLPKRLILAEAAMAVLKIFLREYLAVQAGDAAGGASGAGRILAWTWKFLWKKLIGV